MRGGDGSSRRSEPRALRLLGYASIVLAAVGLAAIGMSVWMRDRPPRAQAAPQPTPSHSLPVVGSAPTATRFVPPSPTEQQPTAAPVLPTATLTATSVPPTATPSPPPQPAATRTATPDLPTATVTPTPLPPLPTAMPAVPVLSIADILVAAPGSRAALEGTVVEISQFTSGVRCTVEDATGRLTLWLPQNVWAHIGGHEAWGVGCVVRAVGTVQLYRQETELVPQQAAEVVLISPAPVAQMVRVGDLSSQDVGRQVAVQGTIVEVWPFSQGIKYLFDDGSGRIVVLLWQGVYNDVPGKERLLAGAIIHVTGVVQEYNGQLEIIPGLGHEISFD